jgi:hypothetical protein
MICKKGNLRVARITKICAVCDCGCGTVIDNHFSLVECQDFIKWEDAKARVNQLTHIEWGECDPNHID